MARLIALTTIGVLISSVQALGAGAQVATCERGPITIGSGPPDWRQKSLVAGPLGVFRHPLSRMFETDNGQLITKMPVLVDRGMPVTLSVPRRLRHRVFLYYGHFLDRSGRPTTQIGGAPGFSEVVFEPCATKPRTVWPGGIRVKGRASVRLAVWVEGRSDSIPLRLGRPMVYRWVSRG